MSFFGKKRDYDIDGLEEQASEDAPLPDDISIDKPISSHNQYKIKPKLDNTIRLKGSGEEPGPSHLQNSMTEGAKGPSYSVDNALMLLKSVPVSDKVVVETIIMTLKSANIDIGAMLQEAGDRKNSLENQNKNLENEIRRFEAEIVNRKQLLQKNLTAIDEVIKLCRQFGESAALKETAPEPVKSPVQEAPEVAMAPPTEDNPREALKEVLKDVQKKLGEEESDTLPPVKGAS